MKIIGTGSAHPTCAVSNEMLEQFLETTDEWITERTGIKERCVISSEKLEDLAVEAANKALENAGLTAADIDFLICSNVVNEYVTPALSCIIQGKIGATCPTIDINAACAGFIYALDMAEDKLQCKKAKNILIVCAEEPSRMVSWQNRSTCVLFGDGAGAAVIKRNPQKKFYGVWGTEGNKEALGCRGHLTGSPYIYMDGQTVFRFATQYMTKAAKMVLEQANLTMDDIDYVLCHQANERIIDYVRKQFKAPEEKFFKIIHKYGNTSAASIPLGLAEMDEQGLLTPGKKVVIVGFGAGFTWGSMLLEF